MANFDPGFEPLDYRSPLNNKICCFKYIYIYNTVFVCFDDLALSGRQMFPTSATVLGCRYNGH